MAQTRTMIIGKLYTDQRVPSCSKLGGYTRGASQVIRCFGCGFRKLCVAVRGRPTCRSCRESS